MMMEEKIREYLIYADEDCKHLLVIVDTLEEVRSFLRQHPNGDSLTVNLHALKTGDYLCLDEDDIFPEGKFGIPREDFT